MARPLRALCLLGCEIARGRTLIRRHAKRSNGQTVGEPLGESGRRIGGVIADDYFSAAELRMIISAQLTDASERLGQPVGTIMCGQDVADHEAITSSVSGCDV